MGELTPGRPVVSNRSTPFLFDRREVWYGNTPKPYDDLVILGQFRAFKIHVLVGEMCSVTPEVENQASMVEI
jgi:hypothetical protein